EPLVGHGFYQRTLPRVNPLQASRSGSGTDAFLTKLNTSGSALVYSTYLGGSGNDAGTAVAVDTNGAAYLTGYTIPADFVTVNPIQPEAGGSYDGFVSQFSPDGRFLVQSTYLGGSKSDAASAIAVTGTKIYVVGQSASLNFPVFHAVQQVMVGG